MRLVVDTNIFISAALKDASWPGETLRWLVRYGGLLKTSANEQEIRAVLARPRLSAKIPQVFHNQLDRLFALAELVTVTTAVAECRDPKDDKFLELALSGRADLIVSGDADLLVLNPFREIPIITAAAFIAGTIR
jgi:putative PIN family toxin of toxin-antitoxin system